MKRQQSGFTLVEIAIVLVIIGLLLGGVLKGQELINSAKAKAVISDFRNTATMIAAYQDRFRALPGDDGAVVNRLGNNAVLATTPAASARNNGMIDGDWDSVVLTDESLLIWQHLRLANLIGGNAAAPTAANIADWWPRNSEGGRIGVQSLTPIANWTGRMFVCQGNVSGRIAQQVDTTMDDGIANTGSVRFGAWAAGVLAPPAAVVENTLYVVCASF